MRKVGCRGRARARCAVVCLVLAAGALSAAEPPSYTLEDCLRIGLQRAGTLLNAWRDREIAETTIGQVGAQVYPQLGASLDYLRMDERTVAEFGDQRIEMGALDNYSAGINLRQLLYSGGSVSAALQAAKSYRDIATYQVDQVRAALIRDIHAGFYDLLLLEAVVEVHEQSVELLRDMVAQTERRFEQDSVSEFEVLNARVQLDNARPDLIRARNQLSLAKNGFRNLLQLDEEDFTVQGELRYEAVDTLPGDLLDAARQRRPEIGAMQRQVTLREADIRAEQGGYLPSVHVTAGYRGENPPTMLTGASGWDWRWTAGVQLTWDWLDGGLRRNKVRQKQLERDKAEEDLGLVRRAVEQEVHAAYLRKRHAAEAVTASRENIALAERSLGIASTRYTTGLTTRLEYTEVNLALMRARLNWLQALRDHQQAVNDLAFAVGDYAEQDVFAGEEGR